jgi:hypothetical protein
MEENVMSFSGGFAGFECWFGRTRHRALPLMECKFLGSLQLVKQNYDGQFMTKMFICAVLLSGAGNHDQQQANPCCSSVANASLWNFVVLQPAKD